MNAQPQFIAGGDSPLAIGGGFGSKRQSHAQDFFAALFRNLNQMDVRYCRLSAPSSETVDSPSSVELTIHPEDRGLLPSVFQRLRDEGYRLLQQVPLVANDTRSDFAASTDESTRFFGVIVRDRFPSGHLIARDNDVFARRKRLGEVWTLSQTDEFCYLLGKISLEHKTEGTGKTRLNELASVIGQETAKKIVAELFVNISEQKLMAAFASGQWSKIPLDPSKELLQLRIWGSPIDHLKYWLLQVRCSLRRWLQPCGILIVILGPDGSGKSTTVGKISELFGSLFSANRAILWRPQVLRHYSTAAGTTIDLPHSKPPYGVAWSVIKFLAVVADYCVAYPTLFWALLSRRTLITIDRDLHDILVDPLRYRYGGPTWLTKFAVAHAPLPDAVYLILDAEDDVIFSRKSEVTPEELRRQRKAYADLASKLPNASVIRTDRSPEETTSAIVQAVFTFMVHRNERREPAGVGPRDAMKDQPVQAVRSEDDRAPSGASEFSGRARLLVHVWNNLKSWVLKCSTAMMDHGLISLSNFLLGIVLARYLGPEQYGAFALAFSTFVLLSLIHSALAMEPMSVFAPSIYRKTLREYLGLLLWVQLAGSAVIVACTAVGGIVFRLLGQHSHLISAFEGIALASPCVLIFWFARRAFYLQLRPAQALIGSIAYCAALCFGIWALASGHLLSPFAAFVVMGTAALLTSVLLLFLLQPTISRKAIAEVLSLREVVKRHWQYGRWAFASALFIWVPWNVFYSVVAHFSGLSESGALKALLNFAMPMTQTYAAFSLLFISQAARLGHEKGWEAVKILAWRIAGLYALGSGAYWILVCLFRNQLIRLMYAGHYQEMSPLIPVIAVASILSGAAMGPTIAIRAMRSPASVAGIYFGSALISAAIGIPACKAWGIRGAVIGILLSSIASVVTGFMMVRSRRLHARMMAPGAERLSPESASAGT